MEECRLRIEELLTTNAVAVCCPDLSARRDARKAEVMTLEQAHEYADQLAELQGMRDSILNSINKMKDESR